MPLALDLLRHGAALPDADGRDDARRLSPRGRADIERLASHLAGIGWCPGRAFSSPLVRARDSALITLRAAAPQLTLELMDALRPDTDPSAVLDSLAAAGSVEGHVFLVGHQPLLGQLAGLLAGGAPPGFAPGTLARFEFPGPLMAGQGVAAWRLAPGFTA